MEGSQILPTEQRKLRACLLCSLIKTQQQFKKQGCENCEEVLQMTGSTDSVLECTSAQFEGMIGMIKPERSWTARWQRTNKFLPGLYATAVYGRLPDEIVDTLESSGVTYRARDGATT